MAVPGNCDRFVLKKSGRLGYVRMYDRWPGRQCPNDGAPESWHA
jgi:hypothetical protein